MPVEPVFFAPVRRLQGYPEDGSKLAVSRIGIAHDNSRLLLARIERHPERYPDELQAVGLDFTRVLHVHACMALSTLARRSATLTAVATAKQLLTVSTGTCLILP